MATQVQLRGGTTSEHSSFTGAAREVTVDTDKDVVVVHDGSTAGGIPLAKEASVLPLAGGTMTGTIAGFTSTGIDDNATSTAITIDASENVSFAGTGTFVGTAAVGNSMLLSDISGIYGGVSSPSHLYINIDSDDSSTGARLYINKDSTGTAGTNIAEFQEEGDVKISTGNLVIGTSGKGIDFSADGNAAGMTSEVLDDYEEGTFTPTLNDGTNAGTADISSAVYTKVGNRVYVNGWVRLSSLGSMTGASVYLGGLPFTTVGTYYSTLHIGYFTGLAITAGTSLSGYIQPNSTISKILVADLADAISGLSVAELSANGGFMFSAHYTTNS